MGRDVKTLEEKRANILSGKDWTRYSVSVWSDIKKDREEITLEHPALFPKMLVERLIKCFMGPSDEVVIDPFMGSGSTLIGARNTGKKGIGFEISKEYIELAKTRLDRVGLFDDGDYEFFEKDARELIDCIGEDSVDLCITSPPYWDILTRKRTADYKEIRSYSEANGNLGLIDDYNGFLNALADVFGQVYRALKPGKYCVINVMDIRKKEKFFPLHMDISKLLTQFGYLLDDIIIWDRRSEYNNLRPLGYPYVFRINKVHEFLLVFQVPKGK